MADSTKKTQVIIRTTIPSVKYKAVTGITLTVPAGAISAIVDAYIPEHPLANAAGNDIGSFASSSLSVTAGILTTEVSPDTADTAMTGGQYWVDYYSGRVHICKATSGTTNTIAYSYFVPAT